MDVRICEKPFEDRGTVILDFYPTSLHSRPSTDRFDIFNTKGIDTQYDTLFFQKLVSFLFRPGTPVWKITAEPTRLNLVYRNTDSVYRLTREVAEHFEVPYNFEPEASMSQ